MQTQLLVQQGRQLQSKINALKVRERGFLLMAVLALLYLFWDGFFQAPKVAQKLNLQATIESHQAQLKKLKSEELTLSVVSGVDPDAFKKRRVTTLLAEIKALDESLSELSHGLVAAEYLPEILEDVLLKTTDLKLLKLQTLAVQELQLAMVDTLAVSREQAKDEPKNISAGVFKHSVLIQVEGSYFELLSYLESLEQLPWRFYWERVDYQVGQYPKALVEVRVYTLSAEAGLIGV